MRELVRRWQELVDGFTGGDPGTREALERKYAEQGPELASRGAVSEQLQAYVRRAIASLP